MIDLSLERREWWYLAGLVATDGCLIRGSRVVVLVAKDSEFLEMIRERCGISNRVRKHFNGRGQLSHRLNICGRKYWNDLARIGLTPAKSKSIGRLAVPDGMYFDFIRGVIDGDGSIRSWIHPVNGGRQWSTRIYSASPVFLEWVRGSLFRLLAIRGRIHHAAGRASVLKYGKMAAQILLAACYDEEVPALERKRVLALQCVTSSSGWSRSNTVGQVAKLANAADS